MLDGNWGYDRYGNRRTQTVVPSSYQQQLAVNTANNQVVGFTYDAVGNLLHGAAHSYTYDAESNMTSVGGVDETSMAYRNFPMHFCSSIIFVHSILRWS